MNDITRIPDQSTTPIKAPSEKNECELHPERFSFSFTDKAASAFAWAVSLGVLFVSAAAILVAFFRSRDNGRGGQAA